METLFEFAFKEKYNKIRKLKSTLEDINKQIDWETLLLIFKEKKVLRGRPSYDKILMLKVLFLQGCYSLSDEEMEYQIHDRLSFQNFLDIPKSIPDYSTIWRFREQLTEGDTTEEIWDLLQKQLEEKNIEIKKGVIQDTTFIHADPGKKNSGMNNRGREAKTSRSKDGSWTKKGKKSHFGFKLHTKVQRGSKLITGMALTTAKTHDGAIDLANPDDINYRDKGYSGINTKAKGDATMKKGNLSVKDKLRNKRISKKRCQGEHPFGTMCRSLKAGTTKLTTIPRVFVQQLFVCLAYNFQRASFFNKLARAI